MKKFTHFLFYNNTVPILFGVLFLGTTATFAASPEARSTIISSEQAITSIDNSFIRSVNLSDSSVSIEVQSVEEGGLFYFVTYEIQTIDIEDSSWQPVTKINVLQIEKSVVEGKDLGLYVSEQLLQLHRSEMRRLHETQGIETSLGETQKVLTTKYSGLIGRRLDEENEVLVGYVPVFEAPAAERFVPPPTPREPNEQRPLRESSTFTGTVDGEVVTITNVPSNTSTSTTPAPTATTTVPVIDDSATTTTTVATSSTIVLPATTTPPVSTPTTPESETPVLTEVETAEFPEEEISSDESEITSDTEIEETSTAPQITPSVPPAG